MSNEEFSMEKEEKIKVFITDMDTDTNSLIYSRIKDYESIYIPQLFCSDNYVFLYEYSNKEGEEGCRITRFDKDGKKSGACYRLYRRSCNETGGFGSIVIYKTFV